MRICDFCGKTQREVKIMITNRKVDICNECVIICMVKLTDSVKNNYLEIEFANDNNK